MSVISPELALVDPDLAAHARASLPPPGALPRHTRGRSAPVTAAVEARPPVGRTARSRLVRWAVALGMALVGVALLAEVAGNPNDARRASLSLRPEQGAAVGKQTGRPSRSPVETRRRPVATTAPPSTRTHSSAPPSHPAVHHRARTAPPPRTAPTSRKFAWAPVQGASGYLVEIFRGPARVYRATAASAQIVVPASWTLDGKRYSLRPGLYRWYVWPEARGRPGRVATVQARLVIGQNG